MQFDEISPYQQETPIEQLASEVVYQYGVVLQARGMLACPYLAKTGDGVCVSGCYSEPSCATDEPLEGWEAQAQNGLDSLRTLLAPALGQEG